MSAEVPNASFQNSPTKDLSQNSKAEPESPGDVREDGSHSEPIGLRPSTARFDSADESQGYGQSSVPDSQPNFLSSFPGDDDAKVDRSFNVEVFRDDYEDINIFGAGGMGTVFKARDKRSQRDVVIKLMTKFRRNSVSWARFQREAKALAVVKHPNIVAHLDHGVHWDSGDEDALGFPYLVMEYVPGKDLHKLVDEVLDRDELMEPLRLVKYFAGLARALIECHKKGLIHRDVKPMNLVIDDRDGRPVLIDFGLVRAEPEGDNAGLTHFSSNLTQTGDLIGTPVFMSPEQFFGRRNLISAATDVWAFGATLYYAASGYPPYQCQNIGELSLKLETVDPAPLWDICPEAPEWVNELCLRCLKLKPQERITMPEIERLLRKKLPQTFPLGVMAGALLVILGILAATYFLLGAT